MPTGKTIALIRQIFTGKVLSLLFNMLSRLVITFLARSKHLLISWLQSPSAVILELPKIKSVTVSPSICHEVMELDATILVRVWGGIQVRLEGRGKKKVMLQKLAWGQKCALWLLSTEVLRGTVCWQLTRSGGSQSQIGGRWRVNGRWGGETISGRCDSEPGMRQRLYQDWVKAWTQILWSPFKILLASLYVLPAFLKIVQQS